MSMAKQDIRARTSMQRFFRSNNFQDFKAAISIYDQLPRSTLRECGIDVTFFHEELSEQAHDWVRWQPWLASQGYALNPRYEPGWIPSWVQDPSKDEYYATDNHSDLKGNVKDAVRLDDGTRVWLKRCANADEMAIAAYFSSEPMRSDRRNHCCPLLDVLCPPLLGEDAYWILVFPLLGDIRFPLFQTVGECVEFLAEVAEGLAFMHEHNVAHRDICVRNTMMDASKICPTGWFPPRFVYAIENGVFVRPEYLTRSVAPVRYYLIDFDVSVGFPSFAERRYVAGTRVQNHPAPELSDGVPYDPFSLDMFMFGDMMRTFVDKFYGLEMLRPLVSALTSSNPLTRPTAEEVHGRMRRIVAGRAGMLLAPFLMKRITWRLYYYHRYAWSLLRHYLSRSSSR